MRIVLENVTHRFDDRLVLDHVDLTLTERRVGIVGANGSGKSTLIRLLNALVLPDDGRVTVDGIDVRADPKAARRTVGFVFQNPDNQIVMPIVAEDVAFGLRGRGLDKAEVARRVDAALERFGLEHLRDRTVHRLSGGEKQLAAIAGVWATRPRLLVMDEPTTALDLRNRRRVIAAIRGLEEPVIAATHDLDWLGEFDRVLLLDAGRVIADGPADEVRARYRELNA